MGKISTFLDIISPLLMLTSVKLVESLLEDEAVDEVEFSKLALHVPYHHNFVDLPSDYQNTGAELKESKKSKKSFASFRIRPKGKFISNYFQLSLLFRHKGQDDDNSSIWPNAEDKTVDKVSSSR